jgi:hypothetical protein
VSQSPDRDRRAAIIAASQRCPDIAHSVPPGPAWRMVGCRTWTNFDRARAGAAPLRALDWPPPELR